MCGIFGYISKANSLDRPYGEKILKQLYTMSETRGKEASGLMVLNDNKIEYLKDAIAASELIRRKDYKKITSQSLALDETIAIFGHSRLVTNGEAGINSNNQPVHVDRMVGIHNGIITNEQDLWEQNNDLSKQLELDTEVFLRLLEKNMENSDLRSAFKQTFDNIEGVVNIALMFEKLNIAVLSTNNGSLYYSQSDNKDSIIFASEKHILEQTLKKCKISGIHSLSNIEHLSPNSLLVINLSNLNSEMFMFNESHEIMTEPEQKIRSIADQSINKSESDLVTSQAKKDPIDYTRFYKVYEANKEKISQLKRCTRCILPETMPFITFDNKGVCNYCKSYKPHKVKGVDELKKLLPKTKKNFDCLVTLSGGRDSSYGLHYIKAELGLNPVTYTYDWGMVTDLARRNQMRMCGSLGVEHILVSADIQKKRRNIQKNVAAWLKKPELGMIPLFMAGDKQYFYWSNKIAEQTKVSSIILCENLLETTKFKSGFCGIEPIYGTENTYTLSLKNKFQMLYYYGLNFIKNPGYLNVSLLDTIAAFSSYYVMKHNFINLFDYIEWDESTINDSLINRYRWERSLDTESTWRIGDGTAAFYNYIYYTMAGMTENDTFRSNQVREGQITRDQALVLSEKENHPRFESIKWYLDTINLTFIETVDVINSAKKLY